MQARRRRSHREARYLRNCLRHLASRRSTSTGWAVPERVRLGWKMLDEQGRREVRALAHRARRQSDRMGKEEPRARSDVRERLARRSMAQTGAQVRSRTQARIVVLARLVPVAVGVRSVRGRDRPSTGSDRIGRGHRMVPVPPVDVAVDVVRVVEGRREAQPARHVQEDRLRRRADVDCVVGVLQGTFIPLVWERMLKRQKISPRGSCTKRRFSSLRGCRSFSRRRRSKSSIS